MKSDQGYSQGRSIRSLLLASAFALVGAGCGSGGDAVEDEVVGTSELGLSNTNWALVGAAEIALAPVAASKRLDSNNSYWWTIGNNSSNQLRWNGFVTGSVNNWTGWSNVTGATNASAHNATSWPGSSGTSNRNVAVGWIDTSGNAKVVVSNSGSAINWGSVMNLGGGNTQSRTPALAYSNGRLFMFAMKPAVQFPGHFAVRYKWATADNSGNIGTWSSWTNLPEGIFGGGIGAAASSTSLISVAGVGDCGDDYCTGWIGRLNATTLAFTFWVEIPWATAYFKKDATIALTSLGQGTGTNGARAFVTGDFGDIGTATLVGSGTSAWSLLNVTGCRKNANEAAVSAPSGAVLDTTNKLKVVANCAQGFADNPKFTTVTP